MIIYNVNNQENTVNLLNVRPNFRSVLYGILISVGEGKKTQILIYYMWVNCKFRVCDNPIIKTINDRLDFLGLSWVWAH